jgi:hypothetical protein
MGYHSVMNNRMITVVALLAFSVSGLAGCEKKEGSSGDALDKLKQTASDATADAKKKLDEGFASLRDQAATAAEKGLEEAKSKIGLLKEKANAAGAEMKPAIDSAIKGIEDQAAKVQAKIPELKSATSETWKSISDSISSESTKLMDLLKDAISKYGSK